MEERGPQNPESGSEGAEEAQTSQEEQKSGDRFGDKPFPTRGTAPSAPDIRSIELLEPSEEAKAAVPSDTDAMGRDKRREVIGHSYGPSRKSQLMFFGIVAAVLVVLIGGGKMLADRADEPPDTNPDAAPWSAPDAPQTPAVRPQ